MNRACVFAHYDRDNIVDAYVYYYLVELQKLVKKLIFVTVSDISMEHVLRLQHLNIEIIKRKKCFVIKSLFIQIGVYII